MIRTTAAAWLGAFLAAAIYLAAAIAGQAAEVKVLGFLSMRPILTDLAPEFERATGDRLAASFDSVVSISNRVLAGEIADAVITSRSALDDLAGQHRIAAGGIGDVARISIRLFVRAGAPNPDIGSVETLKHTLLTSDSLAFTDPARGALAGRAFAEALNRLGIANQVRFKSKLIQGLGTDVVTAVASGAAVIGAAPTNDLTPPPDGIDILGPLPSELETDIVISAGVLAKAQSPAAALGFRPVSTKCTLSTIGRRHNVRLYS
jgi:molybdate transport system substrate-binding protein